MGAVKAGKSSNLLSLLSENNTEPVRMAMSDVSAPASKILEIASKYLDYLKYDDVVSAYGKLGVKRFYASLFSSVSHVEYVPKTESRVVSPGVMPIGLESIASTETTAKRKPGESRLLKVLGYVAYPAKVFSKLYDFAMKKTGSHLLAYGTGMVGLFETIELSIIAGVSAYTSYTYNIPFLQVFFPESRQHEMHARIGRHRYKARRR